MKVFLNPVLIICSLTISGAFGAEKLKKYYVDQSKITVSGISSGAAMASQFHFAHSSKIQGVGLFAGVPYMCGNGGILKAETCMLLPSTISVQLLISEANTLDFTGQIDATSNIRGAPVWIFHGTEDTTVFPASGPKIQTMYEHYGANVKTVFSLAAEHGQPTNDYGAQCNKKSPSTYYINNCNYNGAFEMLNYLYDGSLTRPTSSVALLGDFLTFDQSEFFYISPPSVSSMDSTGYIYVPSGCRDGSRKCLFHIAFHGCHQHRGNAGDAFARKTGYLEAAELNNIIVLFPQTIATLLNPNACWDWWGYLNIYFPTKEGNQILAVHRMLNRVVSS